MKRSEMVKVIKDFNNEWNQNPTVWFDYEYADKLLEVIEGYMVPLKEFDCGCCASYEWEDEND